jgi:isoleucyl-tRNA synthetase
VDDRGHKMSKSLGNVIEPNDIIHGKQIAAPTATAAAAAPVSEAVDDSSPRNRARAAKAAKKAKALAAQAAKTAAVAAVPQGIDALRLWAVSADFTGAMALGPSTLEPVLEMLRVVRGTARFVLSVLDDFSPDDRVPYAQLQPVDQWALHTVHALLTSATGDFETYAFAQTLSKLRRFVTIDLNAFYVDLCKDRLYFEPPHSRTRRAVQTVFVELLRALTLVLAPIVPHVAEDLFQHTPPHVQSMLATARVATDGPNALLSAPDALTVFALPWPAPPQQWVNPAVADLFDTVTNHTHASERASECNGGCSMSRLMGL